MIATVSSSSTSGTTSINMRAANKPSAEEMFKKLDADGKGYLTQDDLVKISPAGAEAADSADAARAQEMFQRMDADADGKVSESEFKQAEPSGPPPGEDGGAPKAQGGQAGAGGPPPAASGGSSATASSSANQTYEAADANEDGKVTTQEQQAYDAQQAARQASSSASKSASLGASEAVKAYDAVAQAT